MDQFGETRLRLLARREVAFDDTSVFSVEDPKHEMAMPVGADRETDSSHGVIHQAVNGPSREPSMSISLVTTMGDAAQARVDVWKGSVDGSQSIVDAQVWSFRLPAVPASATEARHRVRAVLESTAIDLTAVELAVSEAVTNVVRHGYRDGLAGSVDIELAASDNSVDVVISDAGVGPLLHPDSEGAGLGLMIMRSLADTFEFEGEPGAGTTVRMSFAVSSRS